MTSVSVHSCPNPNVSFTSLNMSFFYYFHVNRAVLFLAVVHFNFEKYASLTENCVIVHECGLNPRQLSKTFQRLLYIVSSSTYCSGEMK